MKTLPDSIANFAISSDDRADVVQFVGGRNQASVGIGSSQMRDVVFLAFPPGRFGIKIPSETLLRRRGTAQGGAMIMSSHT